MTGETWESLPCGDSGDARYCPKFWELTNERDRYRKALEAIAECRAGMPYPVLAREALEGGQHE